MKDYLIIGNSAAGIAAAREIRRCDPAGRITIVSDEPHYGYSRVLLPLYLGGRVRKKDLLIAPKEFYASLRIRLLRSDPAVSLDPMARRVATAGGKVLPYDALLVATGASPRNLGVPGENLPGVVPLRRIADAERIRKLLLSSAGPVVLAGGGLVGVKSLEALAKRRREIHLVVSSDRVLSQMLDGVASGLFLENFRRRGVNVHLRNGVEAFEGQGRLEAALLSDGTRLPCCLALVGKGVTPNVGLLKGTAAALNQGIKVDGRMATSIPGVYAAGDAAEHPLLRGGNAGNAIWPLAVEGGRVAGQNMVFEGSASLAPAVRMNSLEALGLRVVSAGDREGEQELKYLRRGEGVYRKLAFSGNRLSGFLLAGDIRGAGVLTSLIRMQSDISPSALEEGLERGFTYAPKLQALGGIFSFRHFLPPAEAQRAQEKRQKN